MLIFAIIISIVAGVSIVFTRIFNTKMAMEMGLFQGATLNYVVGLLVSVALTLCFNGRTLIAVDAFKGLAWWAYIGGLLGIAIVVLSSYLTQKISVFYLTLLIFIGQLFTGIVLDFLVAGDLAFAKIIGGLLVVLGFVYNLRVDTNSPSDAA